MLYFTDKKGNCTGCSACMAACPVKCITLQKDAEGFLYPVASDVCIKCGKCERVCPIENPYNTPKAFTQEAYCALTKDHKIWQRSTSGGAFSEICRAFGDEKTIFCGAVWDDLKVHHVCVEGVKNIAPLCKSKYVASSPENVFVEIQSFLQKNKKVVFCGTPCQVAGLKSFLNKEYDSLLLIDFICHGVGSPSVFIACTEALTKQLGKTVSSYEFRAKERIFVSDYMQKIYFKEHKAVMIYDDPYIQLFLSQNCLRPSCGSNCRYRNEERQGDITIADFKGLFKVFPDLIGTKKNYSTIVISSPKGAQLVPQLYKTMQLRKCHLDAIKEHNPLFCRQTYKPENRNIFFSDFKENPKETINKWTKPAKLYKESWRRKLFKMLPVLLRKIILNKKAQGLF